MLGLTIPHFGLSRQYSNLREELLDATDRVLRFGIFLNGPYSVKFEQWLAERTKCKYAITVHSGTQALEIMARYERHFIADLFFKDPTVIIPNITYPATMNAFLNAGYKVELHDTDKNGLLAIDRDLVKSSDAFRYVCPVGLYGAPINDLSYDNNIFIDGAQHWPIQDEYNVGSIGMAISFDPTKVLPSSGNGGAIITNRRELYQFALDYRNNDVNAGHKKMGTNSKMSEQDCAHLLVRTLYFDDWQKRRKQIRKYYIDRLSNLPLRLLSKDFKKHADQKFVIYTEDRDQLQGYLQEHGIETRIHYRYTLSQLPVAAQFVKPDILSTSVMLTRGLLSLPIYPELTDNEIEYISNKVRDFFTFR